MKVLRDSNWINIALFPSGIVHPDNISGS